MVREGTEGAGVKELQARLNREHPAYSKLAEDGIFGPATEAVVREFQHRRADGHRHGRPRHTGETGALVTGKHAVAAAPVLPEPNDPRLCARDVVGYRTALFPRSGGVPH
ncbi:peptidoglycan-binding domain-containing protein [Mycobacterium sp.]|uniref:peptidoglycan-binding domain-containing protein n=1 Tax=Mycobacterium sp. TaxID=1785 RepID=UPI0039C9CC2D